MKEMQEAERRRRIGAAIRIQACAPRRHARALMRCAARGLTLLLMARLALPPYPWVQGVLCAVLKPDRLHWGVLVCTRRYWRMHSAKRMRQAAANNGKGKAKGGGGKKGKKK